MKKLTDNDKFMIHALIKDNINQRINEINKFPVGKINTHGAKVTEETLDYQKRCLERMQNLSKSFAETWRG